MSDTNTLAELFARDPLQLSELDLDDIIEGYAEGRKTFVKGGAKASGPKPDTSLADLGLL
jgi:hypothetical protein